MEWQAGKQVEEFWFLRVSRSCVVLFTDLFFITITIIPCSYCYSVWQYSNRDVQFIHFFLPQRHFIFISYAFIYSLTRLRNYWHWFKSLPPFFVPQPKTWLRFSKWHFLLEKKSISNGLPLRLSLRTRFNIVSSWKSAYKMWMTNMVHKKNALKRGNPEEFTWFY